MNPFIHDPVARHRPEPCRFTARIPVAARRPPRRLLARAVGRLAVAGGLGLAMLPAHALDVNSANAEQLETIRGVGPRMAQIIVQERTRGGRFESMDDLSDRVRGIGPKRVQALQAAGLTVGPGAPAASDAAPGKPAAAPAPAPANAAANRRPATK